MQLPNATTSTHKITAWYAFSPTGDGMEITTIGETLQGIVNDLLRYLNGWEEKAAEFELDTTSLPAADADEFTLQIVGQVYKENTDTPEYGDETLTVYVTVQVQEL